MYDAGAKSAHQLYQKELDARKIITFCGDLDGMLGGGVATGQITEFCKLYLNANKAAMTVACTVYCKLTKTMGLVLRWCPSCGEDAARVSFLHTRLNCMPFSAAAS